MVWRMHGGDFDERAGSFASGSIVKCIHYRIGIKLKIEEITCTLLLSAAAMLA
jgi:hypothetical protein